MRAWIALGAAGFRPGKTAVEGYVALELEGSFPRIRDPVKSG